MWPSFLLLCCCCCGHVVWALNAPLPRSIGRALAFRRRTSLPAATATETDEDAPVAKNPNNNNNNEKKKKKRVILKGLDERSFRHPFDKDLTDAVQRSPASLLESFARRVGASTVEQSLRLDNLAFSLRVSDQQLPRVHALFRQAAQILDVNNVPELYVRQDPRPNAYTLAVDGAAPFVVITSSLLELVDDKELQAVMGHELGHLKCEHSLWLLLGQIAATGLLPLPLVDDVVSTLLRNWRRAAEYTCDRAALLVVQDPAVVVAALLKLLSGSRRGLSAEAYLAQADDYDKALKAASPLVRSSFSMQVAGLTHPLPVDRVLELMRWAKSPAFSALLARGTALDEE